MFCLLKKNIVGPKVSYLATIRMGMVERCAIARVRWLPYSWNSAVSHSAEIFCCSVCDRGESAESFLPGVFVGSLGSSIRVEDAQHELRVNCGG